MEFYGKRVLFLGAHPDDIELGCGALLHRIGKRTDVLCVTLSDNQKNPDLQNVKAEHYESMAVQGPRAKHRSGTVYHTHLRTPAEIGVLLKLRREFHPT
jgi:LmbE family N-acetylglucosaminyl deacetylase